VRNFRTGLGDNNEHSVVSLHSIQLSKLVQSTKDNLTASVVVKEESSILQG
jgi:hypothetical protein